MSSDGASRFGNTTRSISWPSWRRRWRDKAASEIRTSVPDRYAVIGDTQTMHAIPVRMFWRHVTAVLLCSTPASIAELRRSPTSERNFALVKQASDAACHGQAPAGLPLRDTAPIFLVAKLVTTGALVTANGLGRNVGVPMIGAACGSRRPHKRATGVYRQLTTRAKSFVQFRACFSPSF
jgi:hypothetical protein